jgi:hypothetical protein
MRRDWTQNGLGLKLLVGIMTVLLLAGLVLLVLGLARTAGEMARGTAGEARLPGFPDIVLRLPAGARIVETTAAGRLYYVRAEAPSGEGVVFIVDAEAGTLLGRIRVVGGP